MGWCVLSRSLGLPTQADVVIFCNFNKINKIDPDSFVLWMQVRPLLVSRQQKRTQCS